MKTNQTTLSHKSTFVFNGVELTTGDQVSFISKKIPLPEVQAAFTHVDEDGNLNVFSTLLVPFKHTGIFKPSEILVIKVIENGAQSVPLESRKNSLQHGQMAKTNIKGEEIFGEIIAAFDGIVALWNNEIGFLTGGSSHIEPA